MGNKDRDIEGDDGIISEDLTQLMEHIELTGPQRLVDSPEWAVAPAAADLDDAPVLIEEDSEDVPDLDSLGTAEDIELFTDTQFDIGRHVSPGELMPQNASELAAERARWQRRVDRLLMGLKERDRQIADLEHKVEELAAKLATRTLEREGLEAGLGDLGHPFGTVALAATPAAPPVEITGEIPALEIQETKPAPTVDTSPRVRRYLIGVDLVGQVHEVSRHRVNIGRTQDNDLRIVDPTVSRLHAMLTLRGGEATVVDANSRNGVFVNGIQVRYAKLEDGDLVTFGTVRFRYRVGSGRTAAAYAA
jgi:FHA domain-containing protein